MSAKIPVIHFAPYLLSSVADEIFLDMSAK